MFDKRILQKAIWVILIALFGFSSVFNLFKNKNARLVIGKEKILDKDIFEMGGRDEKTFRYVLELLVQMAYLKNAFDEIGLVVSEQNIVNETKAMFSKNSQFNKEGLKEYMQKKNISESGISKMVSNKIRFLQMFFPSRFMQVSDNFIDKLHTSINRVRSGYHLNVNIADFTDQELLSSLKSEDLINFCLDNPELASSECYIFFTDQKTSDNIEKLLKTYKFEKTKLVNGKIDSDILNTTIDFDKSTFNKSTLRTNTQEQYFIYYNPVPSNMDQILSNAKFKEFAAKVVGSSILATLNSIDDKKVFISTYQLKGAKFEPISNCSFTNNFQNKRCKNCVNMANKCEYCVSNDCVCSDCFNPNNPGGLNRATSIILLLGKLGTAYQYTNRRTLTIVIPTENKTVDSVNKSQLKKQVNNVACDTCGKCALKDLNNSSGNII